MKKTPFRIAAERFANDKNYRRGAACCTALFNRFTGIVKQKYPCFGTEFQSEFFAGYFRPNDNEAVEYDVGTCFWMESFNRSDTQNNNDRILALLFCEQIWLDEHK